MSHDYPWALNKVKLQQSVSNLTNKKKLNPAVEVNENTIMEEYKARAGKMGPVEKKAEEKKEEKKSDKK